MIALTVEILILSLLIVGSTCVLISIIKSQIWCPHCDTRRTSGCDCRDRIFCSQAGMLGHWTCGWCEKHARPRFQCACPFRGHGEQG